MLSVNYRMIDVKVIEGNNIPQKYRERINLLLTDLNKLGESKINKTHFDKDKFVIGLINNDVVGFVKLSYNRNFCSIAYLARTHLPNGKGVAKELIKYIQTNLDIESLSAGIVSNVPEKIERLLLACGFIKTKTFYKWSKKNY